MPSYNGHKSKTLGTLPYGLAVTSPYIISGLIA